MRIRFLPFGGRRDWDSRRAKGDTTRRFGSTRTFDRNRKERTAGARGKTRSVYLVPSIRLVSTLHGPYFFSKKNRPTDQNKL